MDKITRHDAIVKLISIPETALSAEDKARIIELLCETVYHNGISADTVTIRSLAAIKGTDNPEMYDRPPNSYISNSSSCG